MERKSLEDFVASLTTGKLRYALAELASLPRAAVVIEERYSAVFRLERVRPAVVAGGLAEVQVRWPTVPIVFTETRPLAQEWTFRFLGAALAELRQDVATEDLGTTLSPGDPMPPRPVSTAEIRTWAMRAGLPVSDRGRLRLEIRQAYADAHG